MNKNYPSHILTMKFDYIEPDTYLKQICEKALRAESGYCCVTNVHSCIMTYDFPDFKNIMDESTFAIPDSKILQKSYSFLHNLPSIATLKGADMMLELCKEAESQQIPIALIGGKNQQVLSLLKQRLFEKFPRLKIVYEFSPPFQAMTGVEQDAMIEELKGSGAQLVFVGLGCPKQERWMAKHSPKLRSIQIGVGAAFDFNAGIVKPSPEWVHKSGLEWLYRLVSEPKRLWKRYLSTSPRFLWLLFLDKLGLSKV